MTINGIPSEDALLAAARAAHHRLTAAAEAVVLSSRTLDEVHAGRSAVNAQAKADYVAMMSTLADAAAGGCRFATAWLATAHGDQHFDPDGEEFGHYKTLPTREVLDARIAAVDPAHARIVIRKLAEMNE